MIAHVNVQSHRRGGTQRDEGGMLVLTSEKGIGVTRQRTQ